MTDLHEYSSRQPHLQQAVEELAEAGYTVSYQSIGEAVMTGPDFPARGFMVRIERGPDRWGGTGPSEDEAFEAALTSYEESYG